MILGWTIVERTTTSSAKYERSCAKTEPARGSMDVSHALEFAEGAKSPCKGEEGHVQL